MTRSVLADSIAARTLSRSWGLTRTLNPRTLALGRSTLSASIRTLALGIGANWRRSRLNSCRRPVSPLDAMTAQFRIGGKNISISHCSALYNASLGRPGLSDSCGAQVNDSKSNFDDRRLNGRDTDGHASNKRSFLMDERGRTVAWMTRTVHRLFDAQSQKILDRKKISIAHWYYLRVLAERGELNQVELSRRVGISSTTAVPALDSMEKRGLLKRVKDPNDRRKHFVRLTDKGRKIVDEMLPELLSSMRETTRNLSVNDLRVFWKVMHEIENIIGGRNGDAAIAD
jgi:DNA-binding MarR family transcriptional regulator